MENYFHSVTLDNEKCKGCTTCIKTCPTEAIRVREGKAVIIKERCIDCGECIKRCPYHAKKAVTDPFQLLINNSRFDYKIAIPAPSLYGQFKNVDDINTILTGLKYIGFDEVFEVSKAAEIVTLATKSIINDLEKPVISSACPAVVRLIALRFPNLIPKILPLQAPMEVAAKLAKNGCAKKLKIPIEKVGVFFISPCAAKVTSAKVPIEVEQSFVDGVLSMQEACMRLSPILKKITDVEPLCYTGVKGIGWATSGGESNALDRGEYIAADGMENVINVLEELDDEKLSDVDFVELSACSQGCIGGPLTVENSFVAKARLQKMLKKIKSNWVDNVDDSENLNINDIKWTQKITYKSVLSLGTDMEDSLKKMEEMEKLHKELPQLDCGACGAPSCHALAEDIVSGSACTTDCVFKLRERVRTLAQELMELESMRPSSFSNR